MDNIEILIIQRAKTRFYRFGYKKTTMDEISKDCRISKKTLYVYFKNKEGLFTHLLLQECRKARTYIFTQLEIISDPVDRLIKFIRLAIEFLNQDNFITRVLKDKDSLNSSAVSQRYHSLVEKFLMFSIAKIIEQGKKVQKFRGVDSKVASYTGLKMLQSFSHLQTTDYTKKRHGYPVDILIDYTLHGIIERSNAE